MKTNLEKHKKHELNISSLSKLLRVIKAITVECLRDAHDNIYAHRASFSIFSACLGGLFNHALVLTFFKFTISLIHFHA